MNVDDNRGMDVGLLNVFVLSFMCVARQMPGGSTLGGRSLSQDCITMLLTKGNIFE